MVPSVAETDSCVRLADPENPASSVTYTVRDSESSVNQLGIVPPARSCDVMASWADPDDDEELPVSVSVYSVPL